MGRASESDFRGYVTAAPHSRFPPNCSPMSAEAQHAISAWLGERDESAARDLMELLYPQVARIARNHLPFRMEEADLVQEIFAKLFLNLHRYDARLPLENWVSRLSINVCRDHLRARARRPELRWSDLSE